MTKIVKVEGEDLPIFWKSHKNQDFSVPLEISFFGKTKGDKVKLSNWHPSAFLG